MIHWCLFVTYLPGSAHGFKRQETNCMVLQGHLSRGTVPPTESKKKHLPGALEHELLRFSCLFFVNKVDKFGSCVHAVHPVQLQLVDQDNTVDKILHYGEGGVWFDDNFSILWPSYCWAVHTASMEMGSSFECFGESDLIVTHRYGWINCWGSK